MPPSTKTPTNPPSRRPPLWRRANLPPAEKLKYAREALMAKLADARQRKENKEACAARKKERKERKNRRERERERERDVVMASMDAATTKDATNGNRNATDTNASGTNADDAMDVDPPTSSTQDTRMADPPRRRRFPTPNDAPRRDRKTRRKSKELKRALGIAPPKTVLPPRMLVVNNLYRKMVVEQLLPAQTEA